MSRHRIIRNLDLSEEYDDDDDDDHNTDQLTDEQIDLMAKGYAAVRQVFPEDTGITRKEIEDSLWYYYFDPAETVKWLLRTKKSSDPPANKKSGNIPKGDYRQCLPFSFNTSKVQTTKTELAVSKAKDAIDWNSIARRPRGVRLGQCGLLGGASSNNPNSDLPSIPLSRLASLAAQSANSTTSLRTGGGLGLAALASRATSTSSGIGLRSLASQSLAANDPNKITTSLSGLTANRTQPSLASFASSIPSPSTLFSQMSFPLSTPPTSTAFTTLKESPPLSKPSTSIPFSTLKDTQTTPESSTSATNFPTKHLSLKPACTDQATQKRAPTSTFVIAQPSSFAVSIFENLIETSVDTTHVLVKEIILASGGNPLADETKIASFAFDTQSPDDVVLRAQSLKGMGAKGGCTKEAALVTERN